jgi:D-alanine-D-alanine ligase
MRSVAPRPRRDPLMRLVPKRVFVLYTAAHHPAGTAEQIRTAEDLTANATAVAEALRSLGHQVRCGEFGRDLGALIKELKAFRSDVVFNLAETPLDAYDKEPHAAALLELLGLPYTGNGPLALTTCKDKAVTKQILEAHSVPTPAATVCNRLPRALPPLTFPLVVKPLRQDGSMGITDQSVVENLAELRRAVRYVLKTERQEALVEEFLSGREFNVSILGNGTDQAPYHVFPPGEYVYHSPRWRVCTFEAKWDESHPSYAAVEGVYPAKLAASLRRTLERRTMECARALKLSGYTRVDFRLGSDGVAQVLDVNPNPDIAPGMGMARSAATAGLSYAQFVEGILRDGLLEGVR